MKFFLECALCYVLILSSVLTQEITLDQFQIPAEACGQCLQACAETGANLEFCEGRSCKFLCYPDEAVLAEALGNDDDDPETLLKNACKNCLRDCTETGNTPELCKMRVCEPC